MGRISLGGSGDQNRKRSHKGEGHGGPASKMSRVLGTPLESEHKFLASKGLSHSSKSHKKVKWFECKSTTELNISDTIIEDAYLRSFILAWCHSLGLNSGIMWSDNEPTSIASSRE